ncbi:MAG: hypothetical protein ACRDQU_00830 [Pseudonocardiaceae bacterium]
MPLPAGYGVPIRTPELLPLESRSAGTYTADLVTTPSQFNVSDVELWVYVSAVSGSPVLNCWLENSSDEVTWTAVVGSGIAVLSGVGNALSNAAVSASDYLRVTSTVGGVSAPRMTYRVVALLNCSNDN